MKPFYITSTLPYVNADPHLGFALELVQADAIARYHRLLGEEVVFNTGTDEHGAKIYKKAEEEGLPVQLYINKYAERFKHLTKTLNISTTHFIRTTDADHKKAAQAFWKICFDKGDIYKAKYKIKYCTGCELEKTDSELENGRCSMHSNLSIEEREEENYFFKFSKYQKQLLKLYEYNPNFVLPDFRFNEIKRFVKDGLKDFSVSRLASKMPWGVSIPGDYEQVMFVWFDALINYISTLGWPNNKKTFENFWPGIQIAGKDNLRQQSAMWQAMLLSAGLPNSKQILIHGFITIDGQKMSKSLGNVLDPFKVVEKYGPDVVRYFLLREIPSTEDGDFSYKKLEERYQADLANGLGNLVQRVLTLIESNMLGELNYRANLEDKGVVETIKKSRETYSENINNFKLHEALGDVFGLVNFANGYVNQHKPWELAVPVPKLHWLSGMKGQLDGAAGAKATSGPGRPDHFLEVMTNLVLTVLNISFLIYPFMPQTAEKILKSFGWSLERGLAELDHQKLVIKKGEVLFPRLNKDK